MVLLQAPETPLTRGASDRATLPGSVEFQPLTRTNPPGLLTSERVSLFRHWARTLRVIAEDRLDLEVFQHPLKPVFAAIARLLEAAEGRVGVPGRVVQMHLAGADRVQLRYEQQAGVEHNRLG